MNPGGGDKGLGLGAGTKPAGGERGDDLGAGTNPAGGPGREVGTEPADDAAVEVAVMLLVALVVVGLEADRDPGEAVVAAEGLSLDAELVSVPAGVVAGLGAEADNAGAGGAAVSLDAAAVGAALAGLVAETDDEAVGVFVLATVGLDSAGAVVVAVVAGVEDLEAGINPAGGVGGLLAGTIDGPMLAGLGAGINPGGGPKE